MVKTNRSGSYLGSIVDIDGGTARDARARLGKPRTTFIMLSNMWKSKEISVETKLCIFNSKVNGVLMHGSETLRTTKSMLQKIQSVIN